MELIFPITTIWRANSQRWMSQSVGYTFYAIIPFVILQQYNVHQRAPCVYQPHTHTHTYRTSMRFYSSGDKIYSTLSLSFLRIQRTQRINNILFDGRHSRLKKKSTGESEPGNERKRVMTMSRPAAWLIFQKNKSSTGELFLVKYGYRGEKTTCGGRGSAIMVPGARNNDDFFFSSNAEA